MDRTIIDDVLEKAWQGATRQTDFGSSHPSTPHPSSSTDGKDYAYNHRLQELSVKEKGKHEKTIPTNADREKELKNASTESPLMKTVIDNILQKSLNGIEKCHTHVLSGETEDSLKGKKKEAPKGKEHVFGNDPNDKRGSELEMVKKKEPDAYKSEDSDLVKSVDAILEKAVYGAGASYGKIERGSGKDESKPGAVRKPQLSEEQKKKIISGAQAKASGQAASTGMHGLAAKIKAEKSLDERTTDLVKSLYGIVNHKRFSKMDPDAGIDRKKEAKMDLEEESSASKNEMIRATHAHEKKDVYGKPTGENKSIDERTSDLHKGFSAEKVGSAVGRAYAKNPDSDKAKRVAARFHGKNKGDSEAQHNYREGMTNEIWAHNLKTANKSQQDVVNTWQTDSAYVTKGARVTPLGPGGVVQDLSKDEEDDNGAE